MMPRDDSLSAAVRLMLVKIVDGIYSGKLFLFRHYWHKLKTLNYITKLIMFSHNSVVTRNYISAKKWKVRGSL